MEVFGLAITLLSIVLTWQTIKNGKWIKEILKTIHNEGEQRHKEVLGMSEQIIKTSDQRHKEIMQVSDQRHREIIEALQQQHSEVITIMEESRKEFRELISRMDERTGKMVELIAGIPQKTVSILREDVSDYKTK